MDGLNSRTSQKNIRQPRPVKYSPSSGSSGGGADSASNGVGADNITEFCKSPLLAFRILQEPGSYASTATVRLDTSANVGTDCELVCAAIHQKVFEAYWQDGETFPSRVVVDDVLN